MEGHLILPRVDFINPQPEAAPGLTEPGSDDDPVLKSL
jgi:hypothetical protein